MFEIRKLKVGELALKPAYKCQLWCDLSVIMTLAAVHFCSQGSANSTEFLQVGTDLV